MAPNGLKGDTDCFPLCFGPYQEGFRDVLGRWRLDTTDVDENNREKKDLDLKVLSFHYNIDFNKIKKEDTKEGSKNIENRNNDQNKKEIIVEENND